MGKNKLKRFRENETFTNVLQPSREEILSGNFPLKGKWASDFFQNENPIVLELGCGKGEYTVNLALEEKVPNAAFLRCQIELIDMIFASNEVAEIWITFPDPQIKYKRTKHRLTNADFLEKYKKILAPDGLIHLKTDSEFLHGYTLGLLHGLGHEILYANHHIYRNEGAPAEVLAIQTTYEKIYLAQGKPITYIRFRLH